MTSTRKETLKDDMSLSYWTERWENGKTGWHRNDINPGLVDNVEKLLNGRSQVKIFFPLCGKSMDMKWMYDQGHTIIGVEGFSKAIEEFFKENDLEYTKEGSVYSTNDKRLIIHNRDLYDCNVELLGKVDAIWDRGSFVAINYSDRPKYISLMQSFCTRETRYLLNTLVYDTSLFSGPPLCATKDDINNLVSSWATIEKVYETDELNDRWRAIGLKSFIREVFLIIPN
ncbi:unnamed protein product [Dimorphilus gyrociliatus]|uniref:thiopurine S-methyltransferase n=1 Tax=Dimorphilus gyrociliatus TaxID=2664684 RepID=A0A7I8VI30_9ANNE|nr:unnamed protein product [Dimorphilus gyrociliatus]